MSCFLPPYLLRELASRRPELAPRLDRTIALDDELRLLRQGPHRTTAPAAGAAWAVHDAASPTWSWRVTRPTRRDSP